MASHFWSVLPLLPELVKFSMSSQSSDASPKAYDLSPLPPDLKDRLAARLSPEERRVILDQGTEPAFCGIFVDNHLDGTYTCKLCGLPLFRSTAKFDSGTGWPSFFEPVDPAHIHYLEDDSHGMNRTEIRCRRCDGHLGHVFPDGPPPTGMRYCLNSVSMGFHPHRAGSPEQAEQTKPVDRAA
jgi:peptide-methionine (R)-S-oxide reductase